MSEHPEPWRPLGVRGSKTAEMGYDTLVDGLPLWLERSVRAWVAASPRWLSDLPFALERRLRTSLPPGLEPVAAYWQLIDADGRLAVVDATLSELERARDGLVSVYGEGAAEDLEGHVVALAHMLTDGGSAWRVVERPWWSLERRVDSATEALVAEATSGSGDAARLMREAWHSCYGQRPDYDRAYRKAVLAVEAVVLPETSPRDKDATLGKAIGVIRDTASRWSVAGLDAEKQGSADTLLAALKTLWHNQERHAGNDGTVRDVPGEEAEAAVVLAATVVQWFRAGLVQHS